MARTISTGRFDSPRIPRDTLPSRAPAIAPRPRDPTTIRSTSWESANATIYAAPNNLVAMSSSALPAAGGDQPHNNLQPYLTFYFCIALQGVFPPRG